MNINMRKIIIFLSTILFIVGVSIIFYSLYWIFDLSFIHYENITRDGGKAFCTFISGIIVMSFGAFKK